MSPDDTTVAVIGLGNLGLAMAAHLADAGWSVRGLDSSSDRIALAEDRGVSKISASALAECDVLCFVVPDEAAIHEILIDGGVLADLGSDHIIISHSTILPSRIRELAARITEAGGSRLLEVPVSGGAERAESGELTLFAAGEPELIAEARPLLDTLGNTLVEVGPIGAGAATKLANQLVTFAAHAALIEALELAESYGVETSAVLEAIGTATGDTWVGRHHGFYDRLTAEYDAAGVPAASRPWNKDTAEILEAASENGLDLPVARLVAASIGDIIDGPASQTAEQRGRA